MKHLPKDKMIISGTEDADTVSLTTQKDIPVAEECADKAYWYEKIDGIDGDIGNYTVKVHALKGCWGSGR